MSIPQIVKDCRAAMEKAVESARRELSSMRRGKASPRMLDTVRVEMYGQMMPFNQVASVAAPEPRLLIVTPLDKGQIKAIEKAIRESDLGLDPAVQGGDHPRAAPVDERAAPQGSREDRAQAGRGRADRACGTRGRMRATGSRSSTRSPRTTSSTPRRSSRRLHDEFIAQDRRRR